MRLSKRTEYAIRALVHLARLGPGQYLQSRDLARHEKLPTKFLESVLLGLKRHGYLESKVGSGGGYQLVKAASQISMGELIRRLEELEAAPENTPAETLPGELALQLLQDKMRQAHAATLDAVSLEQLVEDVQKKQNRGGDGMFYI